MQFPNNNNVYLVDVVMIPTGSNAYVWRQLLNVFIAETQSPYILLSLQKKKHINIPRVKEISD